MCAQRTSFHNSSGLDLGALHPSCRPEAPCLTTVTIHFTPSTKGNQARQVVSKPCLNLPTAWAASSIHDLRPPKDHQIQTLWIPRLENNIFQMFLRQHGMPEYLRSSDNKTYEVPLSFTPVLHISKQISEFIVTTNGQEWVLCRQSRE